MEKSQLNDIIKKQSQFGKQYNETLNYFFERITVGITGIGYVPEITIINQPHSDHLPKLGYLEDRTKTADSELTIYIPNTKKNILLIDNLRKYNEKLFGRKIDERNPKVELSKLNQEFDHIKLETCGKIVKYDDISIEFLETYEPPSQKYSISLCLSALVKRRIPICLETEENQIAYIGEATKPKPIIEDMLKRLEKETGEIILTPPHPEYPIDILRRSVEEIDRLREEKTSMYRYVNEDIVSILRELGREFRVNFNISLDPCHAEGILKNPTELVLIQTIASIQPTLFIEKDSKGKYIPDMSGHHYLACILGHHYSLPSVVATE